MAYKVPFVDPVKHYHRLKKQLFKTIDATLSRGDLVLRGQLKSFEKNLAKLVGTKYAVGVNSGYDALHMSIEAAGIGPGDEVITVAHTFMATISAICNHGAKPVLIDVGKDFNMNMDLVEPAISARTKAIIPVHLNGRVCDMERLIVIAKKHNLIVIEDAAQALSARFDNKTAGSFGLTGCFSFYPFKMLGAYGDGGAVTTNDPKIAHKITLLRYNGEDRQTRKFFYHGYTALLDNLQAAILDLKLKYFPDWVKRRRQIAEQYHQGLAELSEVTLPHFTDKKYFDVYQNYVIRAQNRDQLVKYLDKNGVETLISWRVPMYKQPSIQPNKIHLPETEKICCQVISLPMNTEITLAQVKYVTKTIRQFYQSHDCSFA